MKNWLVVGGIAFWHGSSFTSVKIKGGPGLLARIRNRLSRSSGRERQKKREEGRDRGGRRDRREWRNESRLEAIGTALHYLKGVSIKGDKTILQVSGLRSPLLPPKLWCNWSCSG